jgi:hypothetical protein
MMPNLPAKLYLDFASVGGLLDFFFCIITKFILKVFSGIILFANKTDKENGSEKAERGTRKNPKHLSQEKGG